MERIEMQIADGVAAKKLFLLGNGHMAIGKAINSTSKNAMIST